MVIYIYIYMCVCVCVCLCLCVYFNQSFSGLVVVMAVGGCGWVGLMVVMWGLWFGFGRKF